MGPPPRSCAGTSPTPARRGSPCGWSAACTGSSWPGSAPELAAYYPTVGGTWSSQASEAVLAFLAARGDEVRPLLDQAPQTNEVGRAAALVGGLLRLTERWQLPVRLWEIGASAGLNLQADRFRISGDVRRVG